MSHYLVSYRETRKSEWDSRTMVSIFFIIIKCSRLDTSLPEKKSHVVEDRSPDVRPFIEVPSSSSVLLFDIFAALVGSLSVRRGPLDGSPV